MATKIDELFVSLGLDMTEFERDYAAAQKHVNQAAAQLNRDARLVKMRMEIEMLGYNNADQSLRALAARAGYLTQQIDTQRKVVMLANQAYTEAVRKYGEANIASQRLQERLTREQLALAKLENQLRSTNRTRDEVLARMGERVDRVAEGISLPLAAAGAASLKMAMDAVESENLFDVAMGQMAEQARTWSQQLRQELGLNEYSVRRNVATLYTMFDSMGMTNDKALEMSITLTQLAYDMASFYNLPLDEAFEKLKAGITGEEEPLKRLGIMVDDNTIKTYAYSAGIAQQGQELTQQQKVLARYVAILDQTQTAQGDLARTITSPANQLRMMREAAEMLAVDLGKTLIPELQRMLQAGQNALQVYQSWPPETQQAVLALAKFAVEAAGVNAALSTMSWVLGLPLPGWAKLAVVIGSGTKALETYLETRERVDSYDAQAIVRMDQTTGALQKRVNTTLGNLLRGPLSAIGGEGMAELGNLYDALFGWQNLSDAELEAHYAHQRRTEEAQQQAAEAREKARQERQAALERQAAQQRLQVEADLQNEIYKLTHTEMENELHDVDVKVQQYRQKYGELNGLVEYAETAKAAIVKKYNDQIQQAREELNAQLLRLNGEELQARLVEIERERQAWIKKTQDEVQATEWAEQEKIKAVHDAVYARYGDEIRAVKDAIKAGDDMAAAFRRAHAEADANRQAEERAYTYVRQRIGIFLPGDTITRIVAERTPEGNGIIQQVTDVVREASINWAALANKPPQVTRNIDIGYINVSVPIQTAANPADIPAIADKAADIIVRQIQSRLGDDNAY